MWCVLFLWFFLKAVHWGANSIWQQRDARKISIFHWSPKRSCDTRYYLSKDSGSSLLCQIYHHCMVCYYVPHQSWSNVPCYCHGQLASDCVRSQIWLINQWNNRSSSWLISDGSECVCNKWHHWEPLPPWHACLGQRLCSGSQNHFVLFSPALSLSMTDFIDSDQVRQDWGTVHWSCLLSVHGYALSWQHTDQEGGLHSLKFIHYTVYKYRLND